MFQTPISNRTLNWALGIELGSRLEGGPAFVPVECASRQGRDLVEFVGTRTSPLSVRMYPQTLLRPACPYLYLYLYLSSSSQAPCSCRSILSRGPIDFAQSAGRTSALSRDAALRC